MPKGQNPNSKANLTKSHGGTGHFNSESARKAGLISISKAKARKKMRDDVNRDLVNMVFDEETTEQILENIKRLALGCDPDMMKLFAKIKGIDRSELDKKKIEKDIKKTEKETKRIETDTKRIEAETELIKLKLVSTEDAEDDGFIDAIEGRLPDVWEDGDPE